MRYHQGVSRLEFGLLETNEVYSVHSKKVSNSYEELSVEENPVFFKAEDDEELIPIYNKGYKGFYYIFERPDFFICRIFYHLSLPTREENRDEF